MRIFILLRHTWLVVLVSIFKHIGPIVKCSFEQGRGCCHVYVFNDSLSDLDGFKRGHIEVCVAFKLEQILAQLLFDLAGIVEPHIINRGELGRNSPLSARAVSLYFSFEVVLGKRSPALFVVWSPAVDQHVTIAPGVAIEGFELSLVNDLVGGHQLLHRLHILRID